MPVLLLGSTKSKPQNWRILHRTDSFEEMAEQIDMYCKRSIYKAYCVISEKHFDYNTNTIVDPQEAFSEVPSFMETAFLEARYGRF